MDSTPTQHLLRQLAESYGVEPGYHDDRNQWHDSDPESLLAVLRVLGAPVGGMEDVEGALRERRQSLWRRPLEPVLVAWDGVPPEPLLRLPVRDSSAALGCRLEFESGETRFWPANAGELPVAERAEIEGVAYEARKLRLPSPLPIGWHKLTVQWTGGGCECTLMSAPTRAYGPEKSMHTWGALLPLYAVRTVRLGSRRLYGPRKPD